MSLPLDVDDQLIDRTKSSMFLYYVARATHRVMKRDVMRKKVALSIKQLKKISTKELRKHVDALEMHITEAIHREKQIQGHQKSEESVHGELKHKITKLESKLGKYLDTQEARKKRMEEIEQKIKEKFATKREKINMLKEDYKKLQKLYNHAKKAKAPKRKLQRMKNRMITLKTKITFLK